MNNINSLGHTSLITSPHGKLVDQEFWDFFSDEENQKLLRGMILVKLTGGNYQDAEDLVSRIKVKYSKEGCRRPVHLNRSTLAGFAVREIIDYQRERKAIKRGAGAEHVSIDLYVPAAGSIEDSVVAENVAQVGDQLRCALDVAAGRSSGKARIVVNALTRWLELGCSTESFVEVLTDEEKVPFLELRKGESLRAKVGPTFTAVKKLLREILGGQGDLDAFFAS